MDLRTLAAATDGPALEEHAGSGPVDVTDIVLDSRAVGAGALFCCVRGQHVDGHAHAADALQGGASALLVDHVLELDSAQLVTPDVRAAVGPVASAFHGHPSRDLRVIGVTGTNGKTTVTFLLRSLLTGLGRGVDVIGTLSTTDPGSPPTTPDAPELQARLAAAREQRHDTVAMEVSSHALAQHRVAGTRFDAAIFTNLGRDHLDFHGDLDAYFNAKAVLFDPGYTALGIVNLDDDHGRRLHDTAEIATVGYSLADAEDLNLERDRSTFRWRGQRYELHLGGRFNVSNALAALTYAAERFGEAFDPDRAAAGLASLDAVAGRWERIDAGQPFTVVVDYAHTPDAIAGVLRAARELVAAETGRPGRVLIVFGAGGDKDRGKRPAMGEVAGSLADVVVLTSDNPRSEDPWAIIEQVRQGTPDPTTVTAEPDRRAAIALVLAQARPGDVVVIAGKGHETDQEIAGVRHPFDDRAVTRALLAGGLEDAS